MSKRDISHVVESFERCTESHGFLDRFYELFLAASPEVGEKFRNTDFDRQKRALRESLQMMLAGADFPETGIIRNHMERLARRHSRSERDVPPELYDLWLDALVQAVSERDPDYTEALGRAWREAMRAGIEFMRANY